MNHFTVLGARGFIGSRLFGSLARAGHRVDAPPRDASLRDRPLGHVLYSIGLTADFRTRPFDTVTAHVCKLNAILRDSKFESLTYLSSTRVYSGLTGTVDEASSLRVDPNAPGDLYNLSKLLGESIALHAGRPAKIARISNVYGADHASDNFLASVMRAAVATGSVTLHATATSAKDYVSLDDVVEILPRIAVEGRASIYNVCSGTNISNAQLAERLSAIVPCRVDYAPGAEDRVFPRTSNDRLRAEFGFRAASLLDDLPALVEAFRDAREVASC